MSIHLRKSNHLLIGQAGFPLGRVYEYIKSENTQRPGRGVRPAILVTLLRDRCRL